MNQAQLSDFQTHVKKYNRTSRTERTEIGNKCYIFWSTLKADKYCSGYYPEPVEGHFVSDIISQKKKHDEKWERLNLFNIFNENKLAKLRKCASRAQ